MFNFLKKLFDIKPDKVKYGERGGTANAHGRLNKKGERELVIEGEKYPLRGLPRMHILLGPLATLKRTARNMIIDQVDKCIPDMIPEEQMCEFVKEWARCFDLLIEAEGSKRMKKFLLKAKKGSCHFFQEDDAYRFRLQWFLSKLNMNKVKLSKEDKYYFRGKKFEVDE